MSDIDVYGVSVCTLCALCCVRPVIGDSNFVLGAQQSFEIIDGMWMGSCCDAVTITTLTTYPITAAMCIAHAAFASIR